MKRGMPSGAQTPDGIIFLLALIFSKAPPRYPPHHGAHWAYTFHDKMGDMSVYEHLQTLRRRYKVKKREAPPAQSTCSSGALRSVGCFGCANSRLLSVITQKQMCAKYRTLPSRPSCPVCTICRKHGFSLFTLFCTVPFFEMKTMQKTMIY